MPYARRSAPLSALASILALLAVASPALAGLQQPGGIVIPTTSSLQGLFDSRGEMINAVNDAAATPETFTPACALTFTVVQRDSAYNNSFGWYNVNGSPPALGDLHEFLSCNDGMGVVKMLDIKNDPAYAGGDVAFYEATGPGCPTTQSHDNVFYSQKAYNIDSSQQNPLYHLIIYNSTATPKAFYFAWEDLLAGGDNDFNDLTTFVTGISCTGGGGACQTGKPGVCGDGTLQCQGGQITCVQSNQPSAEACDGLDNDCDGVVDQGDLCMMGEVCDKGSCVPKCNGGEFTCPMDKVCAPSGLCVDPSCVDVSCPEGQKCIAGMCKGPCDGVLCPHGQTCRVGACIDPCAAITCDADQVCVAGACVEKCQCLGCAAGESCQPDGRCLPVPCVGKVCNPGEYCAVDGSCADACANTKCPAGQVCTAGQCVAGMMGTGGGGQGGGIFGTGSGGSAGAGGAGGASGVGGGTSSTAGAGGNGGAGTGSSGGCGCRVGDGESDGLAALGALALAALASRRRPPRRRSSAGAFHDR